ncbi:MAG: manganese-binding transcriptional regulator MntR [Candidatus Omnitrophica bacterium]|nr:manganese-binding transcriptional regulator MntR [Candidatus Omnitrophota bacterium]
MTQRRTQKDAFLRKRKDHAQETSEDYVELVADLIEEKGEARVVDIASRLGVTSVTVSKTIGRLEEAGLLRSEPYRSIFLTEQGKELAIQTKERHLIVLNFLLAIGVSPETAEADSEGMEHHISEETLDRMREFLRD